jgi:HSP20 family protein
MSTRTLTKNGGTVPALFENFFKPWNEWFDTESALVNRMLTVPAVNITETSERYNLSLAVPGMKKSDFEIAVDGNMLTISCAKETESEESEHRYTRKEYNYSSFSRNFTLPEEVSKDKINATYNDGVLVLHLPKKEEAKKQITKNIEVR